MLIKMINNFIDSNKKLVTPSKLILIILGTAISSFGFYNIHQQTGITEGGIAGLILMLYHWTDFPQSVFSLPLDFICYALAFKHLGKDFLKISIIVAFFRASFFRLWEQFPPMLPNLTDYPLAAASIGAILVSIGVGLIIRSGGSSSGDDALALIISKVTNLRISYAYLLIDVIVLAMSLTYIPFQRFCFSIITVTISSFLVDFIHNVGCKTQFNAELEPTSTNL